MKSKYLKFAVQQGQLELVKWMRAQQPPCPCDFWACLRLAEAEAMWTYFEMGQDLVRKLAAYPTTAAVTTQILALIDRGADVNTEDTRGFCVGVIPRVRGFTPLHSACGRGHVDVVKALLDKGADVHAKAFDVWTPLICARQEGFTHIVAMLREKGVVT